MQVWHTVTSQIKFCSPLDGLFMALPALPKLLAFRLVPSVYRIVLPSLPLLSLQVLAQYLGHRWRYIEEHLHAVLGAQCVEVGKGKPGGSLPCWMPFVKLAVW